MQLIIGFNNLYNLNLYLLKITIKKNINSQIILKQMHNLKSSNLSPFHQAHRAQRDTSPSHRIASKHGNNSKLYTSEQVSKMLKAYIQPKILFLKNQLEQKQQIIQIINKKLDDNDTKIMKLNNYLQNIMRRQKHLHNFTQKQQQNNQIEVINQILNDKMKQYWEIIQGQLRKITANFSHKIQSDYNNMEARIQQQMEKFKKTISDYIETHRLKNNNYWLKIKEILNKINSKIAKADETITSLDEKLHNFQQNTIKQSKTFHQLQKSKQVIKKLVELKKSVKNIYENYQNVLQLQNIFRSNVENFNMKEDNSYNLPNSQQSNRINPYDLNREGFAINSKSSKINQIKQVGQSLPMFRKKQINQGNYHYDRAGFDQSLDIIDLQYSVEEKIGSTKKFDYAEYKQQCPIKNSFLEEDQQFKNKYYVPQINNKQNNFNNSKNGFYANNSPLKTTSGQSSYKQMNALSSPHQMSSQAFSYLNITNNVNSQNSRSHLFVNLSLEHRRQMSQSLKQRLDELIQLKNLSKPLVVYADQINYLKNIEGNYIFDLKGNMFKVNKNDSKILQEAGILKFVDKNKIEQLKNNSNQNNSLNKIKQSLI